MGAEEAAYIDMKRTEKKALPFNKTEKSPRSQL